MSTNTYQPQPQSPSSPSQSTHQQQQHTQQTDRPESALFDFSKASPHNDDDEAEFLDNIDLNASPNPQAATTSDDTWRNSTSSSRFSLPSVTSTSGRASLASSSKPPLSARSSATTATTATLLTGRTGPTPLVLGVAVVDFNHLIGPTVEFSYPPSLQLALQDDEEWARLLPFLALPDGAHLSEEDYSYFHCTYSPSGGQVPTDVPSSQTLFGISCNRQLASSELTRRPSDVTRSMVQKAIVVIASQPVFVSILSDRLGIVTRAYFAQKDFTQTEILEDFHDSLESSLVGKSGEGSIYMGTSLRELIHKFRHRTLVLLKLLMLQKRVMLYGYPVEKLCTYQYSLVSLIPGLLMSLRDSGAPDLDAKKTRVRPTSLRTSDRSSLLRYMGLPLHIFGKDAFFQPYMPLQQIEMLRANSWLVGTTNQIVTQQKDCKYDLLVNIDTNTFEFTDPKLERLVALTPADRKWMDDVVRTVEETWGMAEGERPDFKGSDDDLRGRFEEYICAALSSIKYAEFVSKAKTSDISIVGVAGDSMILHPFSEQWVAAFKKTSAYEMWNGCTDPALFDISEPRHPCEGKVNAVSDLGLRLAEGFHDLHLDQQLGPTRDALSSAFAAGSSSIFKAFDGVRSEVSTRLKEREDVRSRQSQGGPSGSVGAGVVGGSRFSPTLKPGASSASSSRPTSTSSSPAMGTSAVQPGSTQPGQQLQDIRATLGGIGSGIGSFFGSRVASFRGGGVGGSASSATSPPPAPSSGKGAGGISGLPSSSATGSSDSGSGAGGAREGGLRPMSLVGSTSSGSIKGLGLSSSLGPNRGG
ncbi:cytoplasmic protein [Kwoniella heveanensis CBS 569]|uniref:Cytoplasmic protein n=1 Tax=Kwoniella heveanensis BCC8398 TaxID=1296120 RepID=A0A1B9GIU9_9TREE|nr:cytoplasmic protein [Kwoniella heveanensis BCC8398]OCF44511.1 cytoplasmic protein [Kwoniella heveanensis CBS 569]